MANTIDDCRNLERNWDGYGALPIPDEVCDYAEQVLALFEGAKLVEIFPTANESIQLELENADTYFEIEIFEDHYDCFIAKRDSEGQWRPFLCAIPD